MVLPLDALVRCQPQVINKSEYHPTTEDTPKTTVSASDTTPRGCSFTVGSDSFKTHSTTNVCNLPIRRHITPSQFEITKLLLSIGVSSIVAFSEGMKGKSLFSGTCVTAEGLDAIVKVLYLEKVGCLQRLSSKSIFQTFEADALLQLKSSRFFPRLLGNFELRTPDSDCEVTVLLIELVPGKGDLFQMLKADILKIDEGILIRSDFDLLV